MKNNTKNTAAKKIAAAIEQLRAISPVVECEWTDKEANKFCRLTSYIYSMAGDADTECETHRDFVIVWNFLGVWRVDMKANTVKRVVG